MTQAQSLTAEAAAGPLRAFSARGAGDALLRKLAAAWRNLIAWRSAKAMQAALLHLDEHRLRDIGATVGLLEADRQQRQIDDLKSDWRRLGLF